MRPDDHLVEPFFAGLGHETHEGERPPPAEGGAGPRRPAARGRIVVWTLLAVALGALAAFLVL